MAQLIVRKLEDKLVTRLKRRAKEHGVSMEEETRRLLRAALTPAKEVRPKVSLLEHLAAMPNVGKDRDFDIPRGSIDKSVVRERNRRASKEQLSIKEKMRRDMRALAGKPFAKMNFKELLLSVPDFGDDADAYRRDVKWRDINLD